MSVVYEPEASLIPGPQTDSVHVGEFPTPTRTSARRQTVTAAEVNALVRKVKSRKAETWARVASLGTAAALLEGVSPSEVASLLDISVTQLRDYLRGERNIPRQTASVVDDLISLHLALHGVIDPSATRDWWHTPVPRFGGDTPWQRWKAGDHEAVVELTHSYLDPSYA